MTFPGHKAQVFLSRQRLLCCFVFFLGFACQLVLFQAEAQTTSTIQGTVTDTQGAVLSGAKIGIVSTQLGIRRNAVSDTNGRYLVSGLVPGIYDIEVSASGFAAKKIEQIEVTVNQSLRLDATLSVAGVQAEVVVSGETPLLETTTSSSGQTVTPQLIETMPINGRNYLDLLQLVPGVVTNNQSNPGSDSATPILGERSGNALYLIDGMPNSDEVNGGAAAQFNQDSILEFQVLTSGYKAEFGHASGGVINVVSKSGTNSFHGATSFFQRNYVLDSSDISGQNNPPFLLRWDPSAQVGGPIRKDKIFFFASAERIMQSQNLNFQFPPNIPPSLITFETPFNTHALENDTRALFKLDEQVSSHRLGQQVSYTNSHQQNYLPLSEATNLPSTRQNIGTRTTMYGITDTATLGNQANPLLLSLYLQYRAEPSGVQAAHPTAGAASTLDNLFDNYSSGDEFGDLGQVTFGPGYTPLVLRPKYITAGATLAKEIRNHNIKYGWNFEHLAVDGTESNNLFNQLFATVSDFAQYGPINSGVYLLTNEGGVNPSDNIIHLRNYFDGVFFQDDWKLSSKWNINYGLRWDYDSTFPNKTNFSPRAGFEYAMTEKTVVHGNWGMFYDHFRTGIGRDIPAFGGASISRSRYLAFPRLFYGNPSTVSNLFASRGDGAPCLSQTMTDAQIAASGTKCTFDGSVVPYPIYGIDHLNSVVAPGHAPVPAGAVVTESNVQSLTGYTAQQFADAASAALGQAPGYFTYSPFGNLAFTGVAAFGASLPAQVDPQFRTPRSSAWNFGVEHKFGANTAVSIDYFHRDIYNILGVKNSNLAFEARMPGHTGELVPGTGSALILSYGPWYAGTYDSGVITFKKRMSSHFMLQANYQFTHATDDDADADFTSNQQTGSGLSFAEVDDGPLDSYVGIVPTVTDSNTGQSNANGAFVNSLGNPVPKAGTYYNGPAALGSGPSNLALTHSFLLYGLVQLPLKFSITDIFHEQSGFRYSAGTDTGADIDGDGLTNGTDYTQGVNHFQSPAYSDMDVRVAKAFIFNERVHLDLYFEYFNLFNTDNPAAVESLPDQPVAFGGKLQVLPGREGQVGLHFAF
jgi:hypothetical protein